MFKIGQKIVRVTPAPIHVMQSEMIKGHVYTVSWVSLNGSSCKVQEIPDSSWKTCNFDAAEGYELPAQPKTTFEPVVVKTILYNSRPVKV